MEPATFLLVAQCLKQLHHLVPLLTSSTQINLKEMGAGVLSTDCSGQYEVIVAVFWDMLSFALLDLMLGETIASVFTV
jgi:hypothetical protein